MTPDLQPELQANKQNPLVLALEKNQEVKEKVEKCAVDLVGINDILKQELTRSANFQQAHIAVVHNESVEDEVQQCANELQEVNQVLIQGIVDRKKLKRELEEIRQQLSDTREALEDTQEVAKKAQLRALRDSATGLPNRDLFNFRLAHAFALAERHDFSLAVMFIDLDQFKPINDTHGHAVGDRVLQAIGDRLRRQVRSEDTICRSGGDEFLYLLVNPKSVEDIKRVAQKTYDNISQAIEVGRLTLSVMPSIGIAVYPSDSANGEELVENADLAMYRAKEDKAGYLFFSSLSTQDA